MRKQNVAVKEKLPSSFRPFLLMHTGYLVFFNLPSIFINTFFLSIVDDARFTYMYNIILYLIQGIMMIAGAYALRKIPSRYCTRIGILLSSVGYLLLLLLREQSVRFMPLLALVMGAGGAFYWISFAMLLTDSSSDSNRDKAYSSIGLVGAVVTLIIPFTSGNIIRSFTDSTGYFVIFGIAFCIAIITVFLSMHIHEKNAEQGKSRFYEAIQLIKNTRSAKFSYAAIAALGLREGSVSFVLNILLYQMLKDERIIGINTFLTGAAAIFANMLCARIMRPNNRVRIFNISTTILLTICLLLIFQLNVFTVILTGMATFALTALMNNAANSVYFAAFDDTGLTSALRPEMFAIKEVILGAGRIAGIFILYFLPPTFFWCAIGLIILTGLQYITGALCHLSVTARKREKELQQ